MTKVLSMNYTLWSRGKLVGESPLDFVRCIPRLRTGFLFPTPDGERVLSLVAQTFTSKRALGAVARRCTTASELRASTEYADFCAAMNAEMSAEFELRDPNGVVVPTKDICVRDVGTLEELEELERALQEEFEQELAELENDGVEFDEDAPDADDDFPDWDEPWRPEAKPLRPFSRYQLQVELVDDSAIP